jgi:peptidoglycan/LPS O-acetylase OafA/YrhL
LISQSWNRSRSIASFAKKRVLRIYPGYIVAAAICIWVVVPLASDEWREVFTLKTILKNLPAIFFMRAMEIPPAFTGNPSSGSVNGSLWSIPYECWCYIGVLALGITHLFNRKWLTFVVFVVGIAAYFWIQFKGLTPGGKVLGWIFGYPVLWARMLPMFLAGLLAYQYRDTIRYNVIGAAAALAGLAVAAKISYGLTFAMPTLGAYLLFYLCFTSDVKLRNAAKYGDFS